MRHAKRQSGGAMPCGQEMEENGFALTEFLVSTVIILYLSAGLFTMLTNVQGTSGYQTEVLNVMDNTRVAMNAMQRFIVQAGNNPRAAAFTPVSITSANRVQLCADLTGSSGGSQGDPDGDILDANENVTIQYNSDARTIELVDGNNTVQTLARGISAFTLQYYDSTGGVTATGANVRKIRVTISGASTVANPRTHKTFGLTVASDFTLPNRG